jgi:CubicO group peptidase (beta-lactamase class C family)
MTDLQQRVRETIDGLVAAGVERGVQVAAYLGGEQIVDAVAGVADPATGRAVTSDTPFYSFSVGKAAASTLVHQLVERGVFGYDTRLVELWPEFGAHGKENVTVRHVLTHSAGVPGLPLDTTVEDLCDWHRMCAVIADAKLWWEPGTKVGYHAYTFGYLVGEVIRRATGKPISQVLRDEVAAPLKIADELYFGMPVTEQYRLAVLEDAPGSTEMMASMPPDTPMLKAAPPETFPSAALGNRTDVLAADIPAGGKMSARAIARMYAALLGDVDGVRLIGPDTLRTATAVAASGEDQVFGNPSTWALGYSIGLLGSTADETPTVFCMGGAGGTMAFGDTATGLSVGVTKNMLSRDFDTATAVARIIVDAVHGAAVNNAAGGGRTR